MVEMEVPAVETKAEINLETAEVVEEAVVVEVDSGEVEVVE